MNLNIFSSLFDNIRLLNINSGQNFITYDPITYSIGYSTNKSDYNVVIVGNTTDHLPNEYNVSLTDFTQTWQTTNLTAQSIVYFLPGLSYGAMVLYVGCTYYSKYNTMKSTSLEILPLNNTDEFYIEGLAFENTNITSLITIGNAATNIFYPKIKFEKCEFTATGTGANNMNLIRIHRVGELIIDACVLVYTNASDSTGVYRNMVEMLNSYADHTFTMKNSNITIWCEGTITSHFRLFHSNNGNRNHAIFIEKNIVVYRQAAIAQTLMNNSMLMIESDETSEYHVDDNTLTYLIAVNNGGATSYTIVNLKPTGNIRGGSHYFNNNTFNFTLNGGKTTCIYTTSTTALICRFMYGAVNTADSVFPFYITIGGGGISTNMYVSFHSANSFLIREADQINLRSRSQIFYCNYPVGVGSNVLIDGANRLWQLASSRDYKTDIVEKENIDLTKLKMYFYKDLNTEQPCYGFMIDEMETLIPESRRDEFIFYDSETHMPKSFNSNSLVSYCIEKIGKQQKEIEQMKADIIFLKIKTQNL